MAIDIAQLGLSVRSDGVVVATQRLDKLAKEAKTTESAFQRLERSAKRVGQGMQSFGRSLSLYVTAPMIAASAASVKLAIDAQETASKFSVVFRGSVEEANAALRELTETIPLTVTDMQRLASATQDMLVPMGLAREEAAKLSIEAVKLAGDLSSFNNVGADQVLQDIQSALAGSSEPLRKFGIDVRKTRLEAIALANGLIEVGEKLDTASEAQAIFLAITADSADAIGDAARTMESAANQTKFLSRDVKQLSEDLGKELLPIYREVLQNVRDVIKAYNDLSPSQQDIIKKTALLVAALGPLLFILGKLTIAITALTAAIVKLRAKSAFMAAFFGPQGALVLGIIALIPVIGTFGDRMRAAFDEATEGIQMFTAALGRVQDLSVAQRNVEVAGQAINQITAEIVQQKEEIEGLQDMVDAHELSRSLVPPDLLTRLEDARMGLQALNNELANAESTRDRYLEQIRQIMAALEEAGLDPDEPPDLSIEFDPEDIAALQALQDELDPAAAAMRELVKAHDLLHKAFKAKKIDGDQYFKLSNALDRSALAARAFGDSMIQKVEPSIRIMAELEENFQFLEDMEEYFNALDEGVQAIFASIDPLNAALEDLRLAQELVNEAFEEGRIDQDFFDELTAGIDKAAAAVKNMDDTFERAVSEWAYALQAVGGLFEEDSAAAEAFNTALQALNIVLGINAVLKQLAEGDVYSAIPRALAVAAMVASMGIQTGASGSGDTRTALEKQGTGTVLGDAMAKSESIANAIEITADATSKLVGINTGMLQALNSMQRGVTGAATMIAGGAMDVPFSQLTPNDVSWLQDPLGILDKIGLGFLNDWFNNIFGGKIKDVTYGLRILVGDGLGSVFDAITDGLSVQGFMKWTEKKHIFDDYDDYWEVQNLDDQFARQIQLIFQGMADTLMEAALILGLPAERIEEFLKNYTIGDRHIELGENLDDADIEAELAAFFSSFFDEMVGYAIPFIKEFQQLGEGLAETLVRVATSVQVFREAANVFGWDLKYQNWPKKFAEISVGLIEMAGGLDEFIDSFLSFFDKFATDDQKLEFLTDQLTRALAEVGLALPDTRDEVFALMQSLDPFTEAGQAAIAALLSLTDELDAYYKLLEKVQDEQIQVTEDFTNAVQDYVNVLQTFIGSGVYGPLQTLADAFKEATKAADALNASQKEYALIARSFSAQLKRMTAEMTLNVLNMIDNLFNNNAMSDLEGGLDQVGEVANSLFESWMQALESLQEYADSLLLNEQLTVLTPSEQFTEAQQQFNALLSAAQGGDLDAASGLPEAARKYLEEARFMFASGEQYTAIFDAVQSALRSIAIPEDIPEFIVEVDTGNIEEILISGVVVPVDELVQTLENFIAASDLAMGLRDLAQVMNTTSLRLAADLGVPLDRLAEFLGVKIDDLSEATAQAIGDMALMMGADPFDLLNALGIDIDELARASGVYVEQLAESLAVQLGEFATSLGVSVLDLAHQLDISIEKLAQAFGIGIDQFTAEQFTALVDFGRTLGLGVEEIATALDINLGEISDATSLLSQALDLAIGELPPDIQAELGPMLTAIRDATTASDARAAITTLGEYVLGLPADIADSLLPFLDVMGFAQVPKELAELYAIEYNTAETVRAIHALGQILTPDPIQVITMPPEYDGKNPPPDSYLDSTPYNPVIGSYAEGGSIDKTGLYQLHAGEFVVTKDADNMTVSGGDLSSSELAEVKEILRDIRDQDRRYQEEDLTATRDVNSTLQDQVELSRRIANA